MTNPQQHIPLSASDFHILLVLANEPLYGYAILKAIKEESAGRIEPDLGALYRALARLQSSGLVCEAPLPADQPRTPGKPRKYFSLSSLGSEVLQAETNRLRAAVDLADRALRPQE